MMDSRLKDLLGARKRAWLMFNEMTIPN